MDEVRILREKNVSVEKMTKEEKAKLESMTTKEKEMREQLTVLRTELVREEILITSLQRDSSTVETHVANQKKEVVIATDKQESLKREERQLQQKINDLMESDDKQQKTVQELKSKQSNIKNHVDRLVNELAKLNQQIGIDTAKETTTQSELVTEQERKIKLERH